ncbi:hypothetical protein, partial [Peribacillus simplex]|uniref:hypothetical protein n=1 Tax=Peribacillus simplex TaxID=1478 RepID=UPI0019D6855F
GSTFFLPFHIIIAKKNKVQKIRLLLVFPKEKIKDKLQVLLMLGKGIAYALWNIVKEEEI